MLPGRRELGNLHYYLFMNSLDEIKLKNKKAGKHNVFPPSRLLKQKALPKMGGLNH